MSITKEQHDFLQDAAKLIIFAAEKGFIVTAGELFRSVEQQAIYVRTGKSKTMNSIHMKRKAIDLNVFKDGKLCQAKDMKELGSYWESLHPLNSWGGNGKTIMDAPHFSRGDVKPEWARVSK